MFAKHVFPVWRPVLLAFVLLGAVSARLLAQQVDFPLDEPYRTTNESSGHDGGNQIAITPSVSHGNLIAQDGIGIFVPKTVVHFTAKVQPAAGWKIYSITRHDGSVQKFGDDEGYSDVTIVGDLDVRQEPTSKVFVSAKFIESDPDDPDDSPDEPSFYHQGQTIAATANVVDLFTEHGHGSDYGNIDGSDASANGDEIIALNVGDTNDDGIPNYADGIDMFGHYGDSASAPFASLNLFVQGFNPSKAKIRLDYSASDPALLTQQQVPGGDTIYTPAPGAYRLWTKDGTKARHVASVSQGDYIPTGTVFSLSDLEGIASIRIGQGHLRFFVEAVNMPQTASEANISVSIDPIGDGHWLSIGGNSSKGTNSSPTPTPNPTDKARLNSTALDQVTFSVSASDTNSTQRSVYNDETGSVFSLNHGSNQWQQPIPNSLSSSRLGWSDPICYVSGSTMTVDLRLAVAPNLENSLLPTIKVRGIGIGPDSAGYDFLTEDGKGFDAVYHASSGSFVASGLKCKKAFPASTVGFINPLTIEWSISLDNGKQWKVLNRSKNDLFILLNAPVSPPSGFKLFQTVLYYACSKSGAQNNNDAVANTWSLFTSTSGPANVKAWNAVSKKYDRKLYYYKPGQPYSVLLTTSQILTSADGNGECYCFGQLFQDALTANGIEQNASTNQGIVVTAPGPTNLSTPDRMLVKDWTFSGLGTFPPPYSWKMVLHTRGSTEMNPPPTASTYGTYGELINLGTILGQNSAPNPPGEKIFDNHYIILYGGKYYDPSYGVTYDNEQDFETKAIAGYAKALRADNSDQPPDPSVVPPYILRVRKPTGTPGSILFTPSNKGH